MNKTIVNKFTFDHFPSLEKQCHLFSEANDPLLMRERERGCGGTDKMGTMIL